MKVCLLNILVILSGFCFSQKKYTIHFENNNIYSLKKHFNHTFNDTLSLKKQLNDIRYLAIKEGYLLANIDKINYIRDTAIVSFFLGDRLKKASLTIDKETLMFIKSFTNINEKLLLNLTFTTEEIAKELWKIQESLENNGYPFAKIWLTENSFKNNVFYAKINIRPFKKYNWKKIYIKGDESISSDFITNLIGFKEGDIFNQNLVKNITSKLKQLSYISEIKPFELLFKNDGVELFLYLKSQPISSANGIIGFQPNPVTNKLSLTGDISLKLINTIHKGEALNLNWKSIQNQTQSLNTKLNFPFLFHSKFGVEGIFNLYKRDSTFLELKSSIGLQYFLKKGSYLKFFYGRNNSTILNNSLTNSNVNNFGTVQSNQYGFLYTKIYFDYIPNPKSGLLVEIEAAVGDRKAKINDSLPIVTSTTYTVQLNFQWVFPLHQRHVLAIINQTNCYQAPVIYQNELIRFGGQTTQRGFNEQNLFATSRITNSIEYRFLLDKNSRLFLFFDQTWYENNSSKYIKDTPYGFGAGITFGTNLGIFSLSYALGKQFNNPILINDAKIHFGYISYF